MSKIGSIGRKSAIYTVVGVVLLGSACGSAETAIADSENRVAAANEAKEALFGGKATIELPKGFRTANEKERELRAAISQPSPMDHFVGPVDGRSIETSILEDLETSDETLGAIKEFNERMPKNYSGWERSEIVTINGRDWYIYEWKTPEPEEDLGALVAPADEDESIRDDRLYHYKEYKTVINGRVHSISFKALREDMPNAIKEFDEAFDSLRFGK